MSSEGGLHPIPSRKVLSGSLIEMTDTPAPGDFALSFTAESEPSEGTCIFLGQMAIDVLPDGTVDVRGVASQWPLCILKGSVAGPLVFEGVGNTKFVVPSGQ